MLLFAKIKECGGIYENMDLMEATATVVYLKLQNPELSDDDLFLRLKWFKPHLNDSDRIIGITKAKALLFRSQYLIKEIAKKWMNIRRFRRWHEANPLCTNIGK
jgi:hypothetical protein